MLIGDDGMFLILDIKFVCFVYKILCDFCVYVFKLGNVDIE